MVLIEEGLLSILQRVSPPFRSFNNKHCSQFSSPPFLLKLFHFNSPFHSRTFQNMSPPPFFISHFITFTSNLHSLRNFPEKFPLLLSWSAILYGFPISKLLTDFTVSTLVHFILCRTPNRIVTARQDYILNLVEKEWYFTLHSLWFMWSEPRHQENLKFNISQKRFSSETVNYSQHPHQVPEYPF